jgi:hypothetical protein
MPLQRDYILRLIEQAAAVVRRLRELLDRGAADPVAVADEARAAQAALFADSWMLLQRVDVATATALVRDPRQLAVWAELLRIEAQANRAMADVERAEQLERRAQGIVAAASRGEENTG